MTLETDILLDRRRLKRRLFFWRVATVLAVVGAGLVLVARGDTPGPYVARVTIAGMIGDEVKLSKAIHALATDASVRAVIVAINSPGGAVAGGEALHDEIEAVAGKKPVVAVMGGLAASAGYMVAVPAARIFARDSTLTGSIGVLLETGEISGLLRMLGITDETITSGPLKHEPSFTKPLSEQGRTVLQGVVMDLYDQFVLMVAKGRHMDADRVRELADGRVYTGRQALKVGLVDEIGGETEARAWLAREHSVAESLPVRDVHLGGLLDRLLGDDPDGFFAGLLKSVLSQRVNLDGAWALWHP